jgi:hypothetical protein
MKDEVKGKAHDAKGKLTGDTGEEPKGKASGKPAPSSRGRPGRSPIR